MLEIPHLLGKAVGRVKEAIGRRVRANYRPAAQDACLPVTNASARFCLEAVISPPGTQPSPNRLGAYLIIQIAVTRLIAVYATAAAHRSSSLVPDLDFHANNAITRRGIMLDCRADCSLLSCRGNSCRVTRSPWIHV